eukprot:PhF_6_TR38266/c0_g1_i2/m.57108
MKPVALCCSVLLVVVVVLFIPMAHAEDCTPYTCPGSNEQCCAYVPSDSPQRTFCCAKSQGCGRGVCTIPPDAHDGAMEIALGTVLGVFGIFFIVIGYYLYKRYKDNKNMRHVELGRRGSAGEGGVDGKAAPNATEMN